MKFFIDTADIDEIKKAMDMGFLDGVTTNPSSIAKNKKPFKEAIKEICDIVPGPVSAEVLATEKQVILKESRELASIAPNVVVKIPLIPDGLSAVKILSKEDIKTNVTLCFSANQALLVAKVGATYVSPFVGRMDDHGQEGMMLIEEIVNIYENYDYATKVLTASIRHPLHLKEAAMIGADIVTIPFKVLDLLAKHPLTDIGLSQFLADGKKITW